ncbi:hypothetical protein NPIL_54341 [Nephila pilipes]|uniref:Uncharacterized protein n=1 Tax=Nephila pilipes TaxID=299642 RepID=A0A8X6JB21_NEPPI|nr:hypothetical protein NPIL_54341 [Nephila pilipes]
MRHSIINTDTLDPDPVLRCMPTKWTRMLSGKDKALLVKLFYMNEELATVALRKLRLQKNMKTGKRPFNNGRPHKASSGIGGNWIV